MLSRRETLKPSGAVALGLLATKEGGAASEVARPQLKIAGYAYDRVQAIKDGNVGIDQLRVSFHDENI